MKDFQIYIMENSIAYFQTITPYLGMTERNLKVDENLAIRISKMYDTLKLGKGYYEVIGNKECCRYNDFYRTPENSFISCMQG